jgi:hypothetical protein
VLLVRNAILMLVCLNKFVMRVVSFPTYVKVAHFCLWGVALSCVWVSARFMGCVCGLMGKELFCRML